MDHRAQSAKMVTKQMFRLLPIQILLAAVGAVNGIVSSYFASNYVGIRAMSAVGLYGPLNMLMAAVSTMLVGGSVILCGKYMGQNQPEKLQSVFCLDLAAAAITSLVFTGAFLAMGLLDLTGFLTRDDTVRPVFNRFLLGQSIGVLPFLLGNQLPAFLSMENRSRRTLLASVAFIVVNVGLNFLFVQVLRLEAFGLALASSLGLWVFLGVEAQYFFSKRSHLRFSLRHIRWGETGEILRVGFPGAASNGYQTLRGLVVNKLLEMFVGSVGISAYAAANNLLAVFWSVPVGMLAVSRMLISVSIGEEDRQTLTDIMRVMFRRFVPLMCALSALLILGAVPLTRIFFRDPGQSVYGMMVWGLRILPLCMPLSIICMHFVCYGQASGKTGLVHLLSVLDGVVCVAGFSALLIRPLGIYGVCIASVLNGIVTTIVIVAYSRRKRKRFPRTMDELMVLPDDFGAPENERMDLTVHTMDEVVTLAQRVQSFCREKGIDERRACLAGLAMEEMTGNIVDHGFGKDGKRHFVDVRVVHKNDDVILRLKDDCVPFDPGERQKMADSGDVTKNIGLRMVFRIAREIRYQNILGLNVLTVRI